MDEYKKKECICIHAPPVGLHVDPGIHRIRARSIRLAPMPATATLYSALSGDVYGELLPPHGERTERQRVECVGFMREFVNGCRI